MQTSCLVPERDLWLRLLVRILHQNILQLAPVVVSSWFSFLPCLPSVHSWSIFSSCCRIVFCALRADWWWVLLGGGCCLGLRLPLPGCPAGSWRLLAAGCCWRPLMAVMRLVGIGQIGHFVSNAAYCLVVGVAWCWVLPGGGCCLGLMLSLPGCPAGSWRLLAAGCCWRPQEAAGLLMMIG